MARFMIEKSDLENADTPPGQVTTGKVEGVDHTVKVLAVAGQVEVDMNLNAPEYS